MSLQIFLSNPTIQALLFLLFLLLVWEIRGVIIILFISFIIASAIYPITTRLKKYMPQPLALGLPYLGVVALILFLIFSFIPVITTQTKELARQFPVYIEAVAKTLHIQIHIADLRSFLLERLTALPNNVYVITTTVFGELLTFFFILFISMYLLADRETIHNTVGKAIPGNQARNTILVEKIEENLGAWARGQIILSATIFLANFLAYLIIGIPFALPLALLAGILEIIPTIGPIIAAIPAIIIALTISPLKALLVFVLYILIQIVEGNFLVPKIMQQAVGLHPIIVMLAILTGGELMGVAGALIAIPFVSLVIVIWQQARKIPHEFAH